MRRGEKQGEKMGTVKRKKTQRYIPIKTDGETKIVRAQCECGAVNLIYAGLCVGCNKKLHYGFNRG